MTLVKDGVTYWTGSMILVFLKRNLSEKEFNSLPSELIAQWGDASFLVEESELSEKLLSTLAVINPSGIGSLVRLSISMDSIRHSSYSSQYFQLKGTAGDYLRPPEQFKSKNSEKTFATKQELLRLVGTAVVTKFINKSKNEYEMMQTMINFEVDQTAKNLRSFEPLPVSLIRPLDDDLFNNQRPDDVSTYLKKTRKSFIEMDASGRRTKIKQIAFRYNNSHYLIPYFLSQYDELIAKTVPSRSEQRVFFNSLETILCLRSILKNYLKTQMPFLLADSTRLEKNNLVKPYLRAIRVNSFHNGTFLFVKEVQNVAQKYKSRGKKSNNEISLVTDEKEGIFDMIETEEVGKMFRARGVNSSEIEIFEIDETDRMMAGNMIIHSPDYTMSVPAGYAFTEIFSKLMVETDAFLLLPFEHFDDFRSFIEELYDFIKPEKENVYTIDYNIFLKLMDDGLKRLKPFLKVPDGFLGFQNTMATVESVKEVFEELEYPRKFKNFNYYLNLLTEPAKQMNMKSAGKLKFNLVEMSFFAEFPEMAQFVHNQKSCYNYKLCLLNLMKPEVSENRKKCVVYGVPSYFEFLRTEYSIQKLKKPNSGLPPKTKRQTKNKCPQEPSSSSVVDAQKAIQTPIKSQKSLEIPEVQKAEQMSEPGKKPISPANVLFKRPLLYQPRSKRQKTDQGSSASPSRPVPTKPIEPPLVTHIDVATQTDPVLEDELKKGIGEVIMNLKLADFETGKPHSPGLIAKRGEEILDNVRRNASTLKEKLGNFSRGTIFANITMFIAAFCGIGMNSAGIRYFSNQEMGKPKKKVKEMNRKERRAYQASRVAEEQKVEIRKYLQAQWKEQNDVTLNSLLKWASSKIGFSYGRTVLADVLGGMGLVFRLKRHNPVIEERFDLIKWRNDHLMKMEAYHEENAYIGSYDETWSFAGMTKKSGWQEAMANMYRRARMGNIEMPVQGPTKGKNKGRRGIILAVVTEKGVLKGSERFFISGESEENQLADYHQDMTSDAYRTYMYSVIPLFAAEAKRLNRRAVLLIDNAKYHNKRISQGPTQSTKKADLIEFLNTYNVIYSLSDKRPELYKKCKEYMDNNGGRVAFDVYELDTWAQQHGVTIHRLPPYHCHFNPIELLWAQLKGFLCRIGKTTDKIQTVQENTLKFLKEFGPDQAKKLFDHVKKEEKELKVIYDRREKERKAENEGEMPVLQLASDGDWEIQFDGSDDDMDSESGSDDEMPVLTTN